VVLIHGSGPMDRDGIVQGQLGRHFGFDVAPLRDLATALAASGYAVLRYDKRTCWRDSGCANAYPKPSFDFDSFERDARATLDYLSNRKDVDGDRLLVIGHSQGASLVPRLMTRDPRIAGGVLLAGLHSPLERAFAYQADHAKRVLVGRNVHPLVASAKIDHLSKNAAALRRLRNGRYYDSTLDDLPVDFWKQWADAVDRAPALARKLDRPLLIVGGQADSNVPAREALAWRRSLQDSSAAHQVVVLPCVTHALNCLRRPSTGELARHRDGMIASPDIAPSVIEVVTGYLGSRR
jgi:pimeloyl-ACP methyl ester carboxylesterase